MTGTHHVVREVAIAPDEPLFAGHYPGFPVVPGMFVLELVHRAVCAERRIAGLPCGVERAQFHRPVRPGQTLRIEAELRVLDGGLVVSAKAHVAGELAAELRLRYPGGGGVTGDRTAVEAVIPHRDPMLFVDRVSDVEEGVRLVAHWLVTGREPWYPAGSGGAPALCPPGLLLESWAQAAVLLIRWADPNPDARTGQVELLTMFRRATVLRSVLPGTELLHHVHLDKVTGCAAVTSGGATADGSPVLEIGMCVIARRAARDL